MNNGCRNGTPIFSKASETIRMPAEASPGNYDQQAREEALNPTFSVPGLQKNIDVSRV
jgi:hypothetical protein